jgi:DeoR/GlpR family transcriptional regulator of sugar metabolism
MPERPYLTDVPAPIAPANVPRERRHRQIVRTLTLLALLESGSWTVDELSARLGVTKRTVWRDLNVLDELHLSWEIIRPEGQMVRYTRRQQT